MGSIRDAIRQLAQQDGETAALVCTVDEIDKEARTVDCTPINEGAPLLGVNLQANQGSDFGLVIYPEKGAYVVVGFVADGAAGVVLATDKIESAELVIGETSAVIDADGLRVETSKMSAHINKEDIIFNGGKLDGLRKPLQRRRSADERAGQPLPYLFEVLKFSLLYLGVFVIGFVEWLCGTARGNGRKQPSRV